MRQFIILLTMILSSLTAMAQPPGVFMQEVAVADRTVTLSVTTRDYHPDRYETIRFQYATDEDFTENVATYNTSRTYVVLTDQPEGDWYARAIMIDGEGAAKSDWSNVAWYQVKDQTDPGPEPDPDPDPDPEPKIYRYSIAHAPRAEVWETWLEIHAPDGAEISLSWQRAFDGDMSLQMAPLQPGDFRKMRLAAQHRGLPLILESSRPIAVAVIYQSPWGTSVSAVPELAGKQRLMLAGLPMSRRQQSAVVIANQSQDHAAITLRLTLLDGEGELVDAYILGMEVEARQNRILVLTDLIPSPEKGEEWTVAIEVESSRRGIDLLGATFADGRPDWRMATPLD